MRLLVSVSDARDAHAAVRGGAEIVDAKDPRRGALGPVTPRTLTRILAAVPNGIPVSAALGDAAAERAVPRGAAYVKVGLRDVGGARRARSLVHRVVQRAIEAGAELVLVAYADCARARSLPPLAVVEIAAAGGARGVLLDTAFKNRGSLFELLDIARVAHWLAAARTAKLFTALAGSLGWGEPGLRTALALGADIVGVRGAACDGGRTGRVSVARVAALSALVAAAVA